MGKLKISPFAANFGTYQYLGSGIMLGEPGSGPIPANQAHALVKYPGTNPCITLNLCRQLNNRVGRCGDHQYLILFVFEQKLT